MTDLCVAAAAAGPRSDDELLAFLLISTWSLLTGRTLRDAAPADLTSEELIEFWADDVPEGGRAADGRCGRPAPGRR
jgi:hypothetical protein